MKLNLLSPNKFQTKNLWLVLYFVGALCGVVKVFFTGPSDASTIWHGIGWILIAGVCLVLFLILRDSSGSRANFYFSEASIQISRDTLSPGESSAIAIHLVPKKSIILKSAQIELFLLAANQDSQIDSIRLGENQTLVAGMPYDFAWDFSIPTGGLISRDGQTPDAVVCWSLDYSIEFEKPKMEMEGTIPLKIG